jgi:uncharacterized membrane protein HdeD (DUF308 family)
LRKRIGFLILIIPFFFWFTAIWSASSAGFFEDANAVQIMVLGGAISMIAGIVLIVD